MKTIVFASAGYPSPGRPTMFAFVQEIVHAFARKGFRCVVVNPIPFYLAWNRKRYPFHSTEIVNDATYTIDIYRPSFFSTRNLNLPSWGKINPGRLRLYCFRRRVLSLLRAIGLSPDIAYGHFVFDGGAAAMAIGDKYNIPVLVGVGEENLYTSSRGAVDSATVNKYKNSTAHFFPNSPQLASALQKILCIEQARITMLPNGVDHRKFKQLDKAKCRAQLGIPAEAFVVGCVGDFIYRKGANRVAEAIAMLDGVVGVFAGRGGDSPPTGDSVLIARTFRHDELPVLLSACDIFALPTLSEGCCNAVIEAESCGLPVVTSNLQCVSELVDESCSIVVDPLDIKAIAEAIDTLKKDEFRRNLLSEGALRRSKQYDIDKRISSMLSRIDAIDHNEGDVL